MTIQRPVYRIIMITIMASVLLITCGEDKGVDPPTGGDPSGGSSSASFIMPLKLGNSWIYQENRYGPEDTIIDVDTNEWILYDDTTIDGTTWYTLDPGHWHMAFANRDDGLHLWVFEGDDQWLLLKYPAAVGDTWPVEESEDAYVLLAKDVPIEVPAGSYNCYYYAGGATDPYGPGDSIYFWAAPGVGLIRYVEPKTAYEGRTVSELMSVSLK